jgi:hypothetical protein
MDTVRVLCCFLLALPAAAQLDSSALRVKFGAPLQRETFRMPSGFDLVVDYGAGQQVCRLQVPALMPTDEKILRADDMKQRMYRFLLDLVPAAVRGRELRRSTAQMGIASVMLTDYEHVSISELQHAGEPFDQNSRITVQFKSSACESPAAR